MFAYNITSLWILVVWLYYQIRKNFIIYVLYPIARFIISLDIGESNTKKKHIGKKFLSAYSDPLIDPTLDPNLPPATKPASYQELLRKAKKPIKPVKHRKPISKNSTCPSCGAPYLYVYHGGRKYSSRAKKMLESYTCKVCGRQWFPSYRDCHPTFNCPFCERPLHFKRSRKEFDVYLCRHKDCPFYIDNGAYFKYRNYHLMFTNWNLPHHLNQSLISPVDIFLPP